MMPELSIIRCKNLNKAKIGYWFEHEEQGFNKVKEDGGNFKKEIIIRNIETQRYFKISIYLFGLLEKIDNFKI